MFAGPAAHEANAEFDLTALLKMMQKHEKDQGSEWMIYWNAAAPICV